MAFASKSLTGAETQYGNIEREAQGILHGLEKIHPYFFAKSSTWLCTTNYCWQCSRGILQAYCRCLKSYCICTNTTAEYYCKPWPRQFSIDWLSRHRNDTKKCQSCASEINAKESCTDMPGCMRVEEIKMATMKDEHLSALAISYSMVGYPWWLRYKRNCSHISYLGIQ